MTHFAQIVIAAAAVVVIAYRLKRRGMPGRAPAGAGRRRSEEPRTDRKPRLGVVGLVAAREIRQRVRGRPFRVATALLVAGVAAAVVIPAATKGGGSSSETVGVVGTITPAVRHAVAAAGAGADVRVRLVGERSVVTADRALRSGQLDGVIIRARRVVVANADSVDDPVARTLAALLGLANAIRAAGLSAGQAATIAHAAPVPVASLEAAAPANGAGQSTATFGLIIMFVLLSQYLTWTLIGVMEEKSSRVVEVLLATVRPMQLLTGKVLGIAAVVFAQSAALAAFALALGGAVGSHLLHGSAPLVLLSALAWLFLGYAFYCWLYAAAGSTVERQDQVQSLALPLALPMIAGYIMGLTELGSGHAATWFRVLAYVPPTAPFAMTALVGLRAVTWWQFLMSVLISLVSTVAIARLAAAVYRSAILRTGRRVPIRDVLASGRSR